MSTCENCGKSFEPRESLEEVTSLRVLCPQCTAARAAAKAKKAAAAGGARPASAPAPAPRTAAAPVPARKLQTRADAAGAGAQPAARPAPQPAKAPAQAPAARNDRPAARPQARKPQHEIELHSKDLQKRGSREVLVSFGTALVVFLVAGVVLWKVLSKHKAENVAEQQRLERIAQFKRDFEAFDIATEEGAKGMIEFQEENKAFWVDLEFAPDIVSKGAKARTLLEMLQERQELTRRLDEIEAVMARAAELKPSELADQLRRMDELKLKAGIVGPEFAARLEKDRVEGQKVHLERLMATAQTAAATEPLDRAALATLAQTEDEVFKLLDGAAKLWEKNRQDPELTQKKIEYEGDYKAVMKLADDAVERFFTPDVIEDVPWRDLLADPTAWKVAEVKGFEHSIVGGALTLIGPEPDSKDQGVMSIGDLEVWRDFVVEMEITITKGRAEFFFRLPINWQKNVESRELACGEGGDLEAGRTYTVEFRILGSTLVYTNKSEDSLPPANDLITWIQIRKGAFAIAVPRESELKLTKLRAKVLR